MPKLSASDAKRVQKREAAKPRAANFKPIPRGKYVATLEALEESTNYFDEPEWAMVLGSVISPDGKKQSGKLFYHLALPSKDKEPPSDFKAPKRYEGKSLKEAWEGVNQYREEQIKAFFEAFGYTADTDTDEMIDEEAKAFVTVGVVTIKKGDRKGERVNRVFGLEPIPEHIDLDDLEEEDDDDDNF